MFAKIAQRTLLITIILIFVFGLVILNNVESAERIKFRIPEISGYTTLKCDFHMHTVFSDGNVWPTIRAKEIWNHGLDAFSITDHIEYQPHKDDISKNHNRPYEIAKPTADSLNLILIKGTEITRSMPPGHFNAIFLNDINPLDTEKWEDSIKSAFDQGAFIFWNHPPFPQPEGKCVWYPEHEDIYKKGWLHGIEVVNGTSYYPEAHKWCLEKKLTMIGNSDIHDPMDLEYDINNSQMRPMTLVFVKEKTPEAIKEALFARRTVVYSQNMLIGEEEYLKPIFDASIEVCNPQVTIKGDGSARLEIYNKSDIPLDLVANGELPEISFPNDIKISAGKSILISVKSKSKELSGEKEINIPYKVKNMLVAPNEGLSATIKVKIKFIPKEE